MYTCPVCGYDKLEHPPRDFNICPCCYTEFGYEDHMVSPVELRKEWIRNGMRWEGANVMPAPPSWNPVEQLARAGYIDDLYVLTGGHTQTQIGRGPYLSSSTSEDKRSYAVSAGSRVPRALATSAAA